MADVIQGLVIYERVVNQKLCPIHEIHSRAPAGFGRGPVIRSHLVISSKLPTKSKREDDNDGDLSMRTPPLTMSFPRTR